MRKGIAMRLSLVLVFLLLLSPPAALSAEDDALVNPPIFDVAAPDTVRTNLWVAQALLTDIIRHAVRTIPDDGGSVALRPQDKNEAAPLFQSLAHAVLLEKGHEVYLDESDTEDEEEAVVPGEVDYELRFRFESVKLEYPAVGRKLGLWSRWVDRELAASVLVTVVETSTGRLLLDERLQRRFGDRIETKYMGLIEEPTYVFTSALTEKGGIHAILEELVVMGALTGLVAIYFANTSN